MIRPARPDDHAVLQRIDRMTWTPDVSPVATAEISGPMERLEDVLVVEQDAAVVGYVRLTQPGPLPSHAHALLIDGLAVDPVRRGEGLGRALVTAALEEARGRAARKISLRVLAPNAAARRLYESCGFVVEGVLRQEFLLQGSYVDDVLMAHHLVTD